MAGKRHHAKCRLIAAEAMTASDAERKPMSEIAGFRFRSQPVIRQGIEATAETRDSSGFTFFCGKRR